MLPELLSVMSWEEFISFFQYPFVWRAVVVGTLIALVAALLGVTLVLKRFSFIGDGLSHVAFGAMAVAAVAGLTNQMIVILPVTILAAVLLLRSGRKAKVNGDAQLALISVSALAIGYLIYNLSGSSNVSGDVCTTLFGSTSILELTPFDLWMSVGLSAAVIVVFVLLYHKIFAVTFDETFYKASGVTRGILQQNNGISEDNIARFLAYAPDVNIEWLITGKGDMLRNKEVVTQRKAEPALPVLENSHEGIPLIPLSAMAGAFTGETSVMEYECERYVIPAFKGADFLIPVKGDSMQPTYYPGDLVACQRVSLGDLFFQWNKTYVLDTAQEGVRLLNGVAGKDDVDASEEEKAAYEQWVRFKEDYHLSASNIEQPGYKEGFVPTIFHYDAQGDIDGAGVFYNDAIDESSWKLTDTYWTSDKLDQPYFTYLGDEGISELMDSVTFDPPESPLTGAANIREYKHELLAPYHEKYAKALLDWSIGNQKEQ